MKRNRPSWQIMLLFIVAFCGMAFFSPDPVFAGTAMPSSNPAEDQLYQGDIFCPHNWDGLTSRIVTCVQNIVLLAVRTFLEGFLPAYEGILILVLIIAVTFFGILTLTGSITRPTGQTFWFLFKLAAVAQFSIFFGEFLIMDPNRNIFSIMEGLLNIVSNYVSVSAVSACSDGGLMSHIFDLGRPDPTVWDKLDCVLITLLGIGVAPVATGFILVVSNFFFMGGLGIVLFIAALYFLITLLMSFLRAMKIYLMSVIAIGFLICISPLMIPLLLFSHTKPLFDNWLKNLLNYLVIPIFLVAFLTMMIAGLDAVLFRGTSSLFYAVGGPASQNHDFSFEDWLETGVDAEGNVVGRNIPNQNAMGLLQTIAICNGDVAYLPPELSGEELTRVQESMEDTCNLDLGELLVCSIQPVQLTGNSNLEEDASCLDAEGDYYWGFKRNEEIGHHVFAPNIDTDAKKREDSRGGCSGFSLCQVSGAASSLLNVAVDAIGYGLKFIGTVAQYAGNFVKEVAHFVGGACRNTPIPGAVCFGTDALYFAGSVVHGAGTASKFVGRVAIEGLWSVLGELIEGWFDAEALDSHKVAAYHCARERGIATPDPTPATAYDTYKEFLECDDAVTGGGRSLGPRDLLIEFFYIMVAGAVMAYLMLRWLSEVPRIGKLLIGTTRVEAALPGEGGEGGGLMNRGVGKLQHGLEKMVQRRKK